MELTGIRQTVFLDRYALKDETGKPVEKTPEEMWRRVAHAIALVEPKDQQEEWEEKFYGAMEEFAFVPGGRILSGAGTGYKVTYYNCFVIPSPQDSRGGILKTLGQMVEIMSRGGGVGINLSSLRPRGSRVKKVNGFSSGPCNWAELFSVATKDIIQQGGSRRGALMLMLWDWHPDVEEFITVKQDLTRINGANLSVCVSDKFMEAVKNDGDWDLVFPDKDDPDYDTKWDGYMPNWIALGKKPIVHKTIKARKLWDLVADAAWRSAEPGVVFMERYNKWFNNYYWEYVNCVNPCVTGDTLVATENGWEKAKDLTVGTKILTPKGLKPIDKVYNNGKQQIYEVKFSDGGTLKATADHKLRVLRDSETMWVAVNKLQEGDIIQKISSEFITALNTASFRSSLPSLPLQESRQHHQNNADTHENNENKDQQLGVQLSDVHTEEFPIFANQMLMLQKNKDTSHHNNNASGEVLSTPVASGWKTAAAKTTWPTSAMMSDSFLSDASFIEAIVTNKFAKIKPFTTTTIVTVVDTGKQEDVYDVHEPETLTWVTNSYVSLDCGEEGLPNWGVCNLCSINVATLVNENGEMDYKRLAEIAKVGVRFQDDVVDADFYVFDEIKKVQKEGERRIGLGTMGIGDALIKMKLRYGSAESLPVVDKIYRTIRDAAYEASVEIAEEKGPFPKIDIEKHVQGYFIKQLPEQTVKKMKKYGVRNSVVLQQAPTGTTSLLAGVSSGIEPVYEFEFIRKSRLGEHILRHPLYDAWYEDFKKTQGREPKKEDRPNYFVSANDLTPEDHVYIQATIQKYVDASISKTVNAPNSHTVEDVKRLYTLAYEQGCKGIAYMREGSRQGVLSRKEETKKAEEKPVEQPRPEVKPRPMVVHGSTYQVETPVGQAYVTINTNGGMQPLEVFINVGKAGSDVTAMAEALGRLISLTLRMASPIPAMERAHKIAAELIGIGGARSLGFGENRVRSLPDAVAKVIDRHFGFFTKHRLSDAPPANGHTPEEANASAQQLPLPQAQPKRMVTVDLCPSCGEGSLVFEESCKKCYSCGYSEC